MSRLKIDRLAPILILDDEPDICWVLEHLLGQHGFRSETTCSGEQALALMKRQRFPLVFLDLKLADADGFALARQMRAMDAHLRIVIVSGYIGKNAAILEQAKAEGLIHAFLGKPFLHPEILNLIDLGGGE